jgi:RNA polymerase sigma factor (sigma-70 family)
MSKTDGQDREIDDARGALMKAALQGDRAAYETLLRECIPLIRAVARRQGVTPSEVDDVVQDALLTVHRVRATYDGELSFTAWLGRIAQRRAIDVLRRRHHRETAMAATDENHADPDADPSRELDRTDAARTVKTAVAALSPGQREAVEMLVLNEQPMTEVAAQTGKTRNALTVNLHRALKRLRDRLNPSDQ